MRMAEFLINGGDDDELRKVFEICDVNKRGEIRVSHLLELASQHFGPSNTTDFSSVVANLCHSNDVIRYPEFRQLFGAFLGKSDESHNWETEEDRERNRDSKHNHLTSGTISTGVFTLGNPSAFRDSSLQSYQSHDKSQSIHLSLSPDTRMPGDDRGSPSSMSELDSAIGTSTASPGSGRKVHSGCSSMSDREEENFECYGEAEDVECDSDSIPVRIGDDTEVVEVSTLRSPPNSLPPSNFGRRNSWVRRSLRCSPSSNQERLVPPRRWGSFRHAPKRVGGTAVASQLYRTSSFSSGRSSAPDQEDMYSDASLEDDVLDLNHKVQVLQQQVGALAENQVSTDDRYSRVKQDNSALQARVIMLEEQLRETELRAEERLSEEQRRNKDLIVRVEREKQLTVENYSIKQVSLEKDKCSLADENLRLKNLYERLTRDKSAVEEKLLESEASGATLIKDNAKMCDVSKREREELRIERERSSQVIEELRCEIERLRAVEESYKKRPPASEPLVSPNLELEAELKQLRSDNKRLLEQIEDLQAQLLTSRLEEGRTLVSSTNNNSLAAEFEQMDSDEAAQNCSEVEKLRKSLKDCQEANHHLRAYIDGILLNIVENYPQLLEVKRK